MSGSHLPKIHISTPPERGSFPLDHFNQCKRQMLDYMICLSENKNDGSQCRALVKKYLSCRMENNLMAKEDWDYLGFRDSDKTTIEFKERSQK